MFIAVLAMVSVVVFAWSPAVSVFNPKDKVTKQEVKSIFNFVTTRWDSDYQNKPIVLILYEYDTPQFWDFSKFTLAIPPQIYEDFIKGQVNSGHAAPPIRVRYDSEMKAAVSKYKYSIGYLNDRLYVNAPEGIKYIEIGD